MNKVNDGELIIHIKKKPNRTDPFFYPEDKIAEINYKGWKIFAYPDGDIRITDKKTDQEIYNRDASDYWNLTDKILGSDRFEWENNNWFEISATNPKGEFVDLGIAQHDYDSAIGSIQHEFFKLKEKGKL